MTSTGAHRGEPARRQRRRDSGTGSAAEFSIARADRRRSATSPASMPAASATTSGELARRSVARTFEGIRGAGGARCRTMARCVIVIGRRNVEQRVIVLDHTGCGSWRCTDPAGARSDAIHRRAAPRDGGACDGRARAVRPARQPRPAAAERRHQLTGGSRRSSALPTSDETFGRDRACGRTTPVPILTVSRNMLQQSTPDIEAIVRDDLAQVLARAVDSAALVGPTNDAGAAAGHHQHAGRVRWWALAAPDIRRRWWTSPPRRHC